jgi:hypothetical protein
MNKLCKETLVAYSRFQFCYEALATKYYTIWFTEDTGQSTPDFATDICVWRIVGTSYKYVIYNLAYFAYITFFI